MIESTSHVLPGKTPTPPATEQNPYTRRQQLLQELLKNNELLLKNRLEVRHLMTPDPIVVSPSMGFDEIVSLFRQRRAHHVLVCGRGGEVLGVIGEKDLRARQGSTAQQIMDSNVPCIAPDAPLSPAITHMVNENVSCVPVVENDRLCGALTTTDLMLTLQCMMQLWMRLTQVLQQDDRWTRDLEKITSGLDGEMTAAQMAERVAKAREAVQGEVRQLVNLIDLRTDVPTDMPNRLGLIEVLDMFLAMKRRHEQPFCVVVVGIDHFEHIQNNCGDSVSVPLLKAVARLIDSMVRDCDYVARCRYDAFAVVMPQTRLDEAESFCSGLRESARANRDLEMQLRISVGAVSPEPGEPGEELLRRAEASVR
jgi:diguanylate cyclase (GGDEF)-like protein